MRIPDPVIDDVRAASDIVEVVSSTVRLKKRGKSYLGLCPFHTEKTPSFTVSPDKQMFHCFGCGTGGNVFTFLMKVEKVTFPDAVRVLAERAGIALPQQGGRDQDSVHEPLFDACRRAAMFYHDALHRTPEGGLALDYFHGRGFSDETIRTFGLGCSPNSWDGFLRFAQQEGMTTVVLEKAGLAVRRDDGSGFYDRFRGRAMFPILSTTGRTIGFGARKLRLDDPLAKYVNSPETPIYEKSKVLYGLSQTKEAIRADEAALLVEGYADFLSLYQAGIQNVVASSGTALTDDQIRLISRYATSIVLVYDADSAGSKAMMRGVDLIIGHGLEVSVVQLPEGEDPDSFIRKRGADAFVVLVKEARNFLDFKVDQFRSAGLLGSPEGQTRAIRSIVGTIATMNDELRRNLYIKHLAEKHGIYETVLFRELERQLAPAKGSGPARRGDPPARADDERAQEERMPLVERDLLRVMLEHGPDIINLVREEIASEGFTTTTGSSLYAILLKRAENDLPWDPSRLPDEIQDEVMRDLVTDLLFVRDEISKGWEARDSAPEEVDPRRLAAGLLDRRRRDQLDREIAANQEQLKAASARGEDLREYLLKHQELLKLRHHALKSAVNP